jgi:hypothetical protein
MICNFSAYSSRILPSSYSTIPSHSMVCNLTPWSKTFENEKWSFLNWPRMNPSFTVPEVSLVPMPYHIDPLYILTLCVCLCQIYFNIILTYMHKTERCGREISIPTRHSRGPVYTLIILVKTCKTIRKGP